MSTGLDDKLVKARWAQQPNARYTIYDIPILAVCEAEQVTQERLERVVKKFAEKAANGVFPRVHCGHHVGAYDDKPGAGYLDNLRLDGATVYADLVEVPEEIFKDIQGLRYPGRSVEICEDDLESLALLESQKPFFDFPILALEAEASKYSKRGYRKVEKMEEKEPPEKEEVKVEVETPEEEKQEKSEMSELKDLLMQVINMLKQNGQPQKLQTPTVSQAPAEPMSVAYSRQALKRQIQQELEEEAKIEEYGSKLAKFCKKRGVGDEAVLHKYLSRYSTEQASEILELLEAQQQDAVEASPLTKFAKDCLAERRTSTVLNKYSRESRRIQAIAEMAEGDYYDTINSKNERFARSFRSCWPQVENFVAEAVRLEKEDEGQYQRIYHGKA